MGIYLPALAFRQNEIFGYIGVHSLPLFLQALGLLIEKKEKEKAPHKETSSPFHFFLILSLHIKQVL